MGAATINPKIQISPRQDWKLSRLTPYENNPLRHDPADVRSLAAKIVEFGFVDPITVDEAGVILWGHKRRLAAIELKLDTVPVVVISGLSDAQKTALRIAHNKEGRKSAWDTDALVAELRRLEDVAFSVEATGFDDAEIAELFAGLKAFEASTLPSSAPVTGNATPKTATADLTFEPVEGGPAELFGGDVASTLDAAPTSSVRVLQLYLDDDSLVEVNDLIDALNPRFGTTTPTACILAALRFVAS